MTQALKDGLDIEMAILFATKMNLRPAPWIYIVGPSATGKSTIVESLDAIEEAVFLSEIRGTTLVSGFSMQGGSDPSILARFNDFGNGASKSVLLVGDMSVTLSQGSEEVMRVQSLLRDISNGRFYNSYGNGVIRDYPKLHVSIIAGVTMEVWKIDTPEMGERFVKTIICKPSNREKDDRIASEKAVRNTPFRKEMERETKEAVIGAMKREIASPIPYPGEDQMQVFIDLGTFCERIRGSSKVDKFTNINETNTNHAGGTRFATTLAVIAAGAATHLECSPVDERVLRLVRKITRDTPIHYRMILVKALYDMYKVQPFLVRDVIPHIYRDMTIETAEMEISALFRMSVVHKVKVKNKDGQERTAFELDSKIYNLIRKLKLFDDIDQSDPFSVSFTKKPMVFTMKRKSS
jgi:energy-coupling factor transporter ATP-binding protein EcfA2